MRISREKVNHISKIIIDDLEKIKDLEFPIYPTDGWSAKTVEWEYFNNPFDAPAN